MVDSMKVYFEVKVKVQAIFAGKGLEKTYRERENVLGGKNKQSSSTFEELWLRGFNLPQLTTFMSNLQGTRNTRCDYDDDDQDDDHDDDDDDDDDDDSS